MSNKVRGNFKLIGSEESSWLGVPTLVEIREHLIVKMQNLEDSFIPPIDTWDLIYTLAKTTGGISNLMRYYYEPTDEDRLLKRKLPSTFHFDLAQEIANKPGQIIISTNRDRLIEWGMARIGISPQVIKEQRDLVDLIPLQHTKCTLIKLNGDYLDCDRPEFGSQFKAFIEREIQQVYEPTITKCTSSDIKQFLEFDFQLN